jgi:hypothetical protein
LTGTEIDGPIEVIIDPHVAIAVGCIVLAVVGLVLVSAFLSGRRE